MKESTAGSLAQRLRDLVAAATSGIVQAIEGALPAPQPVPVRVRRQDRRR